MIITVNKKELGESVQIVARFAEKKSASLPALAGIMILGSDSGIRLRATNLETSIEVTLSGEVKDGGVVVLPAGTFREITSSFSGEGQVTLEHSGEVVTIHSGGAKSTLKTLSSEDFPYGGSPDKSKEKFSLSGVVLKTLISSVSSCASTSSIRPELACVLLRAEGGQLRAVATDSFRLCEKRISDVAKLPPFSILIPAKNALDIAQTLPDLDIDVVIDDHVAAFSWKNGLVSTRLVNVSYPDYVQIIPKSFVSEATVLRKDFEGALRRVAVFSDAFLKVRVSFSGKDKKLTLFARNTDVGEASESIAGAVTGEDIELSFNHRYLHSPLPLFPSESITISASGIGRPLVIRGVGDTSLLYLVMPMNQ